MARRSSCAATIKVALDQAPEQVVDLQAMITHDLRDVRVANLLFGSIRQRGTRQVAFGQRAESTSVHQHSSRDQPAATERERSRPRPIAGTTANPWMRRLRVSHGGFREAFARRSKMTLTGASAAKTRRSFA